MLQSPLYDFPPSNCGRGNLSKWNALGSCEYREGDSAECMRLSTCLNAEVSSKCGNKGNPRIVFAQGITGGVVSIGCAHFDGWTLGKGDLMPPNSLLKPMLFDFALDSSLVTSAGEIFESPIGLKAERTPGWKPILLITDGVPPRPMMCPGFRPEVTLMSRALSCSSELVFFSSPALVANGEVDTVLFAESDSKVLWPFLGEDEVFGMSPDFGDLLKLSVPLACSLLTKLLPLLKAQWKCTWPFRVFGYLNIFQQYQQM